MLPAPLGAVQVAPPDGVHVHVTPVRIPGGVSVTTVPLALLGPALDAVMV